MESIKLDLNEFLRYGCGGGVLLLTYMFLMNDLAKTPAGTESFGDAAILVSLSIVLGIGLYTVHRALIYPSVMRRQHTRVLSKLEKRPVMVERDYFFKLSLLNVTDEEFELNRERWARSSTEDEHQGYQRGLDRWGAQSHFMYVSALAILICFSVYMIGVFCFGVEYYLYKILSALVLFVVFAISGCVNDYRCVYMDLRLKRESPIGRSK